MINNINSKTPEEIKKGLAICVNDNFGCNERCSYFGGESNGIDCASDMHEDALAYIQQLESRLAQVEMERDAAVKDIEPKCDYCAFMHNAYGEAPCPTEEELETDAYCYGFKWRGVCEENTKEG